MNQSCNYFFSRCIELLHGKAFDSYRVHLHNPITILNELDICIQKFNNKRIKHFDPTITTIGEEAKMLLENPFINEVIAFKTFPKKYIVSGIEECCIKSKDGRKNRSVSLFCKTVCYENDAFCTSTFSAITELLKTDNPEEYERLDTYTSWWISHLQHNGFSRKYVIHHIRTTQKMLDQGVSLEIALEKLILFFMQPDEKYNVIFKLKKNTLGSINLASTQIFEIENLPETFRSNKFINDRFKEKLDGESYLNVSVEVHDFWSALKKAKQIISETIELNFLHDSDINISIDNQALAIHTATQKIRMEALHEKLDGFYVCREPSFIRFIDNYKKLEEYHVTKGKIKSAIRFYTLGNESVDIEHKFLNYWIGLEQLFAAINNDEDSIMRIKTYFKAISGVYYLQRRTTYLLESLSRSGISLSLDDLKPGLRMDELLLNPLLKKRLSSYLSWLNDKEKIRSTLEKHGKNLEQHLTRIYRIRNELVHEGKTTVDLFLVAGHLRHYLIFSIEQITNELVENPTLKNLDNVLTYYENVLDCIKNADNIHGVFVLKTYSGFME